MNYLCLLQNFCLSVMYYIVQLRIYVNNMDMCYNITYPGIRTFTDNTTITFQRLEQG